MRIKRSDRSMDRDHQLCRAITEAACTCSSGIEGRVCSQECTIKCTQCGSITCQCECTPECQDAPAALSIDPDKYPIEPGILPLVFEMKKLGLFKPCWSCEGHLHRNGALWKAPKLWFYCESPVHLRLLTTGLDKLKHGEKLHAPWQIVVTYSDPDNLETTFSLEPKPSLEDPPSLAQMQEDVAETARSLQAIMNVEGRSLKCRTEPVLGKAS